MPTSTRARPRTPCARSWRTIPACRPRCVTFLGDRISESLTGETADIAVKVFGDQLDALDATGAARRPGACRGTPGIADLQFKPQSGTPTFALQLDPAALAASGLKVQDVLDAVQTNYAGATVGQTYAGIRAVNVVLLLPGSAAQPARTVVVADDRRPLRAGAAVAGGAHRADRDALQHRP